MSVRRYICLNPRGLLSALIVTAVALVQIPGVAAASSDLTATSDMGPCQYMAASPGDPRAADGAIAGCAMHDEGGLGSGGDCEELCAVACVSPASGFIADTLAPATSVPDRGFDKIANVSGISVLTSSAAPPPRL